ncbi:indolepyruvate ferredoxin oxidoreductase [Sphingobium xenophagum]|uniref:Indolepyruvate ferredoxin oxidoreductase n=1 Tax=Sphingobium xenophagum TaxID=121428 RepID=A0ABU1X2F6_SPHXE|nr:indolepyruvate ferredoxin oxidoreductase family protein [Sphingobium xenophagum]MDR7155741.1 indolepyruvate ferredoxin oxidoreductase [Sphingobium xenophagum]
MIEEMAMKLRDVSLDDRHRFDGNPFYLNGTQSLVRLFQLEKRRRAEQGFDTAVYVTGYRGSPLGTLDQTFARAGKLIDPAIRLDPAVNEDLAATAIWGTQQVGTFGEGRVEGVSAAWYGKGPGVDRTGDVFKHGNLAGSARNGGVLVIAGDDHTCKSSTTAHQSEYGLVDALIPILSPATISEQIEYGLIGWEMSRYTGLWVGLKVVTEIMDSGESLAADPRVDITLPMAFEMPPGGLSLRTPDTPLAQEERLHKFKIPAALAFARANQLDHVVFGSEAARLGIITVGKAHVDTLQALADLGIDEGRAVALGLRLYKVAMPWPLEPEGVRAFAAGLEQIVVIEEKRGLVEDQLRAHLYGMANAPTIVGKRDEQGDWLFPSNGELGAGVIALGLGRRIASRAGDPKLQARLSGLMERNVTLKELPNLARRSPYFCSGCPHNSSTKVPEGSKAFAGIGCHYLVQPMERETAGYTHMGGEGANWVGLGPYSKTKHMFQNIGDGTYFHSGSLAIRAAVAAGVNITYKILFNDAVAMTGGQPVDGELTVDRVAAQVAAEGVQRIIVVSDDPTRYSSGTFAQDVTVRPRSELDQVQRELREVEGVTVIIYHQTCATELRRLRKRGKLPDPQVAVVINDLVCEGCGDCSRVSNCLSVVPVETEFGRKRAIDLSTCNKDQTCLDGFCPSFVTVEGGKLRRPKLSLADEVPLPEPVYEVDSDSYSLVVTGIGGTGVVTIGALIGMAAHIDGKGVRVMDMTGLAQKGGAVVSHIQLAAHADDIQASKVSAGSADLLMICDLVVGASPDNLGRISREAGRVIANDHESITGAFTRDPDFLLPTRSLMASLKSMVGQGQLDMVDATDLATKLVGDAVGANLFLMGFAWQKGLLPLSFEALDRAIELNGVAVPLNRQAFAWGRRAALDLPAVEAAAQADKPAHHALSSSLDEEVARRVAFLTDYQNAGYAERYREVVERARAAEVAVGAKSEPFGTAVARSLFRLMAYKDEYEVARLHAQTGFRETISSRFEGPYKIGYYMAPPLFARRDPATGHPRKSRFGGWMYPVLGALARGRFLRGTVFDPFGYTEERRLERQLIADYRMLVLETLVPALTAENVSHAVKVAEAAQTIRGFGHVKLSNIAIAQQRQAEALLIFRGSGCAIQAIKIGTGGDA